MYQVVLYEESIEKYLHALAMTAPDEASALLEEWEGRGMPTVDFYLVLALASARWIDHHGPWIGHGTLNLGPLLRLSEHLDERTRRLAQLQATVYVLDLFHNPNYGPYLQLKLAGTQEATPEETAQRLLTMAHRGGYANLAENLFVGLYRQDSSKVRETLYRLALPEFPYNEHKLLIVHRTYDLLAYHPDYAESLLRPAVQYNASYPKYPDSWPRVEDAMSRLSDVTPDFTTPPATEDVPRLMDRLLSVEAGQEIDVFVEELRAGVAVSTLREVVSLLGAVMLLQSSDNEEHIVTGLHCISDVVRDETLPADLRLQALLISLESARTRTMKATREDWLELPEFSLEAEKSVSLDDLFAVLRDDPTGRQATALAARYLQQGGDVDNLTHLLVETALSTQGPFIAIHAAKMIWAQATETRRSSSPASYLHLASAASYLARAFEGGKRGAQRILAQVR